MKAFVITIMDNQPSVQVASRCIKSGEKFGLKINNWHATTPNDMPIEKLLAEKVNIAGLHETYSRIANCAAAFHSHFSLWKHSIEINEPVMVFEHDAVVVNNIPNFIAFEKCISLGKPSYGKWITPSTFGVNPLTSKGYFPGAHCYIMKPQGAKEVIAQAKVFARPTDVFLNTSYFPWLQEYYPWPVEAHDSFTTIQNESGCYAKHNYGETYRVEEV